MNKHGLLLLSYNKDVLCFIDKNDFVYCKKMVSLSRLKYGDSETPSYEPYLPPASGAVFYDCGSQRCARVALRSLAQVASRAALRQCARGAGCERVLYHHYKNIDKLLFLSSNIPDRAFYLLDCLVYADGGRVCRATSGDSHAELIATGEAARPGETGVLSQEEFLCEHTRDNRINCDLNRYVPYPDGLRTKGAVPLDSRILLKTGSDVVMLSFGCAGAWCGFRGAAPSPARRSQRPRAAGGALFRCYFADKQQICKELRGGAASVYNERDWLSS